MYFSFLRFLTTIVISALLFSCTKRDAPATQAHNHFRLNLKEEPKTLDPRKGGDVISSQVQFLLFEGLVRLKDDGSFQLAQAASYDVSADKRVYTFRLRHNTWSNGDPVTAYDFEKSWKDILTPTFPAINAQLFYPIYNAEKAKKGLVPLDEVGVQAMDATTLVVTLEQPTPYFFDLLSFCAFSPVHATIDAKHPNESRFISNGPFVLKDWKHNDHLLLERNPNYWNRENVRPESLYFSMVQNEATVLQMFEKGELDMIGEPLSPIPIDAIATLKRSGRLKTRHDAATTFVTFNTTHRLFSHPKIRKAFAYAIHRKDIVDHVSQLNDCVATNFIPPTLKNGPARSFFIDGDVDTAQKLFHEGCTELGLSPDAFQDLTYLYAHSDLNHKIAQVLQRQWANAFGIEVKLEGLEFKTLMDRLTKRNYQFAQGFWRAQYNDPMNILERFKCKEIPKNYPHWENPRYAHLLEASFFTTGEDRSALIERAEEIFLDEMPLAPIYHWNYAYMLRSPLEHIDFVTVEKPVSNRYIQLDASNPQ